MPHVRDHAAATADGRFDPEAAKSPFATVHLRLRKVR